MKRVLSVIVVSGLVLTALSVFAVLKEGKPVPSFQTTLLDGKVAVVRLEKGKVAVRIREGKQSRTLSPKVLVLDFWATWCPPCQISSKWLSQLHRKYSQKGLVILAISVDEDSRDSVVPFVKAEKMPYLVALDPKAEVANRFRVEALPTIYVVNEKGMIVRVFEGLTASLVESPKELETALQAAGLR